MLDIADTKPGYLDDDTLRENWRLGIKHVAADSNPREKVELRLCSSCLVWMLERAMCRDAKLGWLGYVEVKTDTNRGRICREWFSTADGGHNIAWPSIFVQRTDELLLKDFACRSIRNRDQGTVIVGIGGIRAEELPAPGSRAYKDRGKHDCFLCLYDRK